MASQENGIHKRPVMRHERRLDMCGTCEYARSMSKIQTMIQIRNVPEDLHRRLKARAAMEGISLSGYLLKEMEQVANRPTLQELGKRLATRTAVKYEVSP